MQKSDFISLIKKQSDKLVESWNDDKVQIDTYMGNIQFVTALFFCLYTDSVTTFAVSDMDDKHPLSGLCSLAESVAACRKKLESSELNDDQIKELEDLLAFIFSQVEKLPVPNM